MFKTLLRPLFGLTLLLALLIPGVRPVQASHLLGGEMSYRYLDANGPAASPFRYEITVTLYSNGLWFSNPAGYAPPPTLAQVDFYNRTTGTKVQTVVIQRTSPNGNSNFNLPPPIAPAVPVGCTVQGPSQPFYLCKYVQTVNLPVSFEGYYAVYSVSARNNSLTNINNPNSGGGGNVPLTLYVSMAPPLITNRSPVFSDTAVAIVCNNDTTITLNNAVDPDGDRLVYSFGTPYGFLNNGGFTFPPLPQTVPYFPGFSAATPFGPGAGNFALINAITGIAKYGGMANGLYGVAVDVSEYRTINGSEVLLGVTRRDLQLVVSTCPPTPPPVLPPTTTTPRNYTIEEGQSLSIPITATQASSNHPLVLTVNSALLDGAGPFNTTFNGSPGVVQPGNLTGTATATGNSAVSGTFVFNSACGNARATPYDLAVTVKDNGCGGKLASDLFRITVTRAAAPNDITGPTTVCNPGTARTYTAAGPVPASYRWRVVGGTITGGQGTNAVQVTWANANTTGTIVVKGISGFGCPTDSVVKSVDIRPLPALAVAATATSICLGASTTLDVTGLPGLTYTWTGGGQTSTGTSLTVSPTATTTYTVTGTDGTCTTSANVTVTVTPPPTANAGPDRNVCPNVASTPLGTAPIAGATYSWSPATGLSSTTTAQPTVTLPNTTGAPITTTYTLTVTTGAGCTSTGTVNVTVTPAATADAGPARTTCSGVASAPLGTPALPGYTYSWSPATGLSSTTVAQPTVTLPNTTGAPITATYTVTATSALGCPATATVVVTVNPAAVATPGPAISFCSGTVSAPLGGTAVPGTTYSWSPTTGLSNPTILNPTVTGINTTGAPIIRTYTLTATTANGCSTTATVDVTINPAAVAVAGANQALCAGSTTTLGAAPVPGYTYSWSPATGLSSTTVANPTFTLPSLNPTPIVFTLTATTSNGCVSTSTVTISVNPAAVANAGPAVSVCDGKRVTLGTPALPGYTYSWSPATGLSSATAAQPVFTGVNTTANPLTVSFTLTATTSNGCVSTSPVTVTVNPRPAAEGITGPASVCPTVTGIAYSVPSPAATAYTWLINGGAITSGQGTPAVTVNWGVATTGAYLKVFRLNAQGCSSDTTTLPIVINQILQTVRPTGPGDVVAVAPTPRSVCQADGPYTYRSGSFANGSSYSWLIIGGTQVSTLQNTVTVSWAPVTVPTIGKIVVTETSNPSGGICRGTSDTLRVLINPSPRPNLAIVSPVRVCQTNGPVTFSLPGGFAGSTYVFQLNGTTLAGTGNTRTLATLPAPGTYSLTAQETTTAGCVGPRYTTPFTVSPTPAAPTISGSGFVCNTATAQQYAITNPAPGASYQWTVVGGTVTAGGTSSQVTVLFNATGPYSVSVVETSASPALCASPATTRTILLDNPAIALTNASVDAASNSRIILTWSAPRSGNTPNPVQVMRRVAGAGSFVSVGTVAASATTYTDNSSVDASANSYEYRLDLTNGCGTLLSSTVAQTVRLVTTATPGTGGYDQGSTSLTWNAFAGFPVKEYQVFRRTDAGTAVLVKTVPGTDPLRATIPNADPGSVTGAGFNQNFRVVAVGTGATPLLSNSNEAGVNFANDTKTYNIITPNRDGLNDVLVIDNIQLYPNNTFTVFNRWGREVYKTTNYQNNWGGDDNIAAGNYFYLLTLPNGTSLKNWFEVVK
ncbi:gliding motility-associated C-terminal domain-containing protein [Hymenobacter terrenus]|uniref:gliding motility-associated C-terminal domain-containing protein n=1 Tax=Hymenobacter terrenus TaxID=1629124 RepID=UPI0006197ADD|nr:gliding motility-associated C-terminal domain-containing protein [Hymenobacter terrenus]